MQMLERIGLLYIVKIFKLSILTVFELNMLLQKLKSLFEIKSIRGNIIRIQSNNSTMCGYFCIGFIDFMFGGKTLIDFTSLFFPYDLKKWQCNFELCFIIILNI